MEAIERTTAGARLRICAVEISQAGTASDVRAIQAGIWPPDRAKELAMLDDIVLLIRKDRARSRTGEKEIVLFLSLASRRRTRLRAARRHPAVLVDRYGETPRWPG